MTPPPSPRDPKSRVESRALRASGGVYAKNPLPFASPSLAFPSRGACTSATLCVVAACRRRTLCRPAHQSRNGAVPTAGAAGPARPTGRLLNGFGDRLLAVAESSRSDARAYPARAQVRGPNLGLIADSARPRGRPRPARRGFWPDVRASTSRSASSSPGRDAPRGWCSPAFPRCHSALSPGLANPSSFGRVDCRRADGRAFGRRRAAPVISTAARRAIPFKVPRRLARARSRRDEVRFGFNGGHAIDRGTPRTVSPSLSARTAIFRQAAVGRWRVRNENRAANAFTDGC